MNSFIFYGTLFLLSTAAFCAEIKLMTLNLHAHHPMDEERRIKVYESGKTSLADSMIFYFEKKELLRGAKKREALLAEDLKALSPDILFLQEVASSLNQELNCESFDQNNNAKDLSRRLSGHKVYSACRGNIGWISDHQTFQKFAIQTESTKTTVFESGDNPYSKGLIIEGTAILTSPNIQVLTHSASHLPFASRKGTFFLQWIKFKTKGDEKRWWIAANVHGGHKVQNFEEAVAARWTLSNAINQDPERDKFSGLIVSGDFNAYLPPTEVSTTPWNFFYRWQTPEILTKELQNLNNDRSYKNFATLPESEAKERIQSAVDSLFKWFALNRHELDGDLNEVFTNQKCSFSWVRFHPMCRWDKIDHVFVSSSIEVQEVSGLYSHHNWTDLKETLSDHPAVWVKIKL